LHHDIRGFLFCLTSRLHRIVTTHLRDLNECLIDELAPCQIYQTPRKKWVFSLRQRRVHLCLLCYPTNYVLTDAVQDAALKPIQYATSKSARRAYLSSILVVFTGLTLFGFAVIAYVFFYYAYIPERGFSKPVYLQFEQGRNAYAEVDLGSERLVSNQPYDINVKLHVPRTPTNVAAGNFMVQLELRSSLTTRWTDEAPKVLVQERRPAILTYYSTIMEHVYNVARLPLLVTGWRQEAERLDIALMEGVEFARGWKNIPSTARIELQSASQLQVYDMSISFKTRLRGLR